MSGSKDDGKDTGVIDLDKLSEEEEADLERRFLGALTPEQREELERIMRGEPVGGFKIDIDELEKQHEQWRRGEIEGIDLSRVIKDDEDEFLKRRTPDELERLDRLDRGEAEPGLDLTDLLDDDQDDE